MIIDNISNDIDSNRWERVVILYGTETGTSRLFSEHLARCFYSRNIKVLIWSLEDYDWIDLPNETGLVIFIVSTAGTGSPPSNMKKFWKFLLCKELPTTCLSGISYCVFGLGDSSFIQFNAMARKLDKRLEMLGAKRLISRGEGDDQHKNGSMSAFTVWKDHLWNALKISNSLISLSEFPNRIDIKWKKSVSDIYTNKPTREMYSKEMLIAKLISERRITSSDYDVDVHEYTFEIDKSIIYSPGDVIEIFPQNDPKDVIKLCKLFNWNEYLDKRYTIDHLVINRPDACIPSYYPSSIVQYNQAYIVDGLDMTFNDLLLYHLHISHQSPSPTFFEFLHSNLCSLGSNCDIDPMLLDKLYELSNDLEQWMEYCWIPKRRILEVLEDFIPNTVYGISPSVVFELLQWIRPRSFSISSAMSLSSSGNVLATITVSLISNSHGVIKTPRHGFCSHYLETLNIGDLVPIKIKKGTIQLPSSIYSPKVPWILLCAGSGIAPIRSILQHACIHKCADQDIYLFFGCRFMNRDCLYYDELVNFKKQLSLELFVKGSRDFPNENKVYIQHMMLKQGNLLANLIIEKNAMIYLCGNTRLINGVREALVEILTLHDIDNAQKYVTKMESTNRFQIECW